MRNIDQRGSKNPSWRGGKSLFVCILCGNEFVDYRRKRQARKYCSPSCRHKALSNKVDKVCPECGKTFRAHIEAIYCSKRCSGIPKGKMGAGKPKSEEHRRKIGLSCYRDKNYGWKGGVKYQDGYKMLIRDAATKTGHRYIMEHRQIAEKALGRELQYSEIVHHVNGDISDNRNCNLLICDKSYHAWLHREMSRLYQREHFSPKPDSIESGASSVIYYEQPAGGNSERVHAIGA